MSTRKKAQARIPPIWERILDNFILTANKRRLHENDWRMFYEFICSNKRKMSDSELKRRLIAGGFSADYSFEIVCNYDLIRWCTRPLTPAKKLKLIRIKHPDAAS